MDSDYLESAEFASNSTTCSPQSVLHGSGMFSGSQNFTVTAQTLTNITKHYTTATSLPARSDFGAVDRRRGRPRVYTAKIEGRKSSVTVAMYQGDGAEEQWRQDIANTWSFGGYLATTSPSLPTKSYTQTPEYFSNLWSSEFGRSNVWYHQSLTPELTDLIPFKEVVNLYRSSHVRHYISTPAALQVVMFIQHYKEHSARGNATFEYVAQLRSAMLAMFPLSSMNTEAMASNFLTLEQYHGICAWSLSQYQRIGISLLAPTKLGAVVHYSSSNPLEYPVEIASLPNVEAHLNRWESSGEAVGELMGNGWTRGYSPSFRSNDVLNSMIGIYRWKMVQNSPSLAWLSQANHIFSRLRITYNFDDYVLVNGISFAVEISGTSEDPPTGFLFLCPENDFQSGPSSFRWPLCPAYWSFDSLGVERLNAEEAPQHGFPYIRLITTIDAWSWDASVYAGLRQFHQANGFDPDSQDVARHLRNRLYQLSSETDPPFAHVDKEDSCAVKTDHKSEEGRISHSQDPDDGKVLSSTAIWNFVKKRLKFLTMPPPPSFSSVGILKSMIIEASSANVFEMAKIVYSELWRSTQCQLYYQMLRSSFAG
ncbi:hypothetical protein B0H19DRAFT_1066012 [Mycena capillaripes]|nr:hypothetical protein B0H19DRAFT_1066012 [Mycena capillaripes]